MKQVVKIEAVQQYAAAHEAHYTTSDLGKALALYQAVMAAHPETQEAQYSRTQIQNIVRAVVPKQRLFKAQVELALGHIDRGTSPGSAPNAVPPAVANSPGETP